MASEYELRFTEKAADDVDEIVCYLAVELSNPSAAASFMTTLQSAIWEIQSFPLSGPKVDNEFLPNCSIRKKYVNNYVLYYLPDSTQNMVTVLRIIYGRRNMDEVLKKLEI